MLYRWTDWHHQRLPCLQRLQVKPAWRLPHATVARTPWYELHRFGGDAPPRPDRPKLLLIGAMAGHYSTLLRPTVAEFARDHTVYVLDWANARDVPAAAGRFDLASYVEAVEAALRACGPGTHALAVCQPGPALLVAAARLFAAGDPCAPASITLIGAPIDTRVNRGLINQLARGLPRCWLQLTAIHTVPPGYAGAGRRVYPGLLQLGGFVALSARNHLGAAAGYLTGRADREKLDEFYADYLAVMDTPAEFYLQTVRRVFQRHDLARGRWTHRGQPVDLAAIACPLLTVEGERDSLCPPGQTAAAHGLCPGTAGVAYVQPGVGHYGIFAGRGFVEGIAPTVRGFVRGAA